MRADGKAKKVMTFGEIMLRLSPPGHERLQQTSELRMSFGGGEANVATSLALLGHEAGFCTKLPTNDLGDAAIQQLRRFGVDTSAIARGGPRIGVYFLETGASQRPSKVVYDRAGSSIATIDPDEIDPERVLDGIGWFHFTGITPSLGAGPAEATRRLAAAAKRRGIAVTCDLNFRAKLWTPDEARAAMRPLMEHVDVCICNEEDADRCLGAAAKASDVERGQLDREGYAALSTALIEEFSFETVAITLRESISASRNLWSAVIAQRDQQDPYFSSKYDIQIVDRVGGGDSFAAGLIASLIDGRDAADALEFAVAASCLKHSIPGDLNLVTREEVEKLLESGGTGRVER
ncbi:MAG: sugar kinase [Planctomycetota bacterium]